MKCYEMSHRRSNSGTSVNVSDVSFEVDRGEFRTLIGPKGTDKTTFFILLAVRSRRPVVIFFSTTRK